MTFANLVEGGFRPLKFALYKKAGRGGVIGFQLSTKEQKLFISAIYRRMSRDVPTEVLHIYGEPIMLSGFLVVTKRTGERAPGIYNAEGVVVSPVMDGNPDMIVEEMGLK
jgi:hypothetical protein